MRAPLTVVGAVVLLLGCGGDGEGRAGAADAAVARPPDAAAPDARPPRTLFGGDREVVLRVPTDYSAARPAPLLLFLHGFSANGTVNLAFLGLDRLVDRGVIIAAPDGTADSRNRAFWNATDGCCNFEGSTVDDVGYLRGLVAEIRAEYNVDPRRIYLAGHSNGGFMSYRLACEGDEFAALVSLAGATWRDPARCSPPARTSVLQVHGDRDETIFYAGAPRYPSAEATVAQWAAYDGCAPERTAGEPLDLEPTLAGAETRVERHAGCPAGIDVELWTIAGGSHIPNVYDAYADRVWAWLEAHPKP